MARIRSIHPGLFTDEGYMNLSLAAKAAWPGIWTEADDHGVFEWKPITLKAKLLPADNVDMAELMAETLKHGLTIQFTHEGKAFGVIKGFLKWQRPREPSYRHPFPKAAELFATNTNTPTVGLPQDHPRPTEIEPQREEEGGRREEVSDPSDRADEPPSDPVKDLFDEGVELLVKTGCKPTNARSLIGKWRSHGGDEAVMEAIREAKRLKITEPIAWMTQRFAGKRENWRERELREGAEAIDRAMQ